MSIRLSKPWIAIAGLDVETIPAQLGVFQLGDEDGRVVHIGFGGGNQPFGLRTAIEAAVAGLEADGTTPAGLVRYEVTHGYLSRWEELLMIHVHDHGEPPVGNDPLTTPRGQINPEGSVVAESQGNR